MQIKNKTRNFLVESDSIEYGGCFYYYGTLYIRVNYPGFEFCAIRAYDGKFFNLGHVWVRKVNAKLIVESQ